MLMFACPVGSLLTQSGHDLDEVLMLSCMTKGKHLCMEVNCPASKAGMTIMEACQADNSFCLEIVNGTASLKKNHNYYHECQWVIAFAS